MSDRWRPIPDWPGYEASYAGDIRSVLNGFPYVLNPGRDPKGYLTVTVNGSGRRSTKRVHRLVAAAWLPPAPKGKPQVRHLDGNKENCAVWNLKHGDQADQERDKKHAGTSRVKRGMLRDGSEDRGKEGNRTEAYRAADSGTSRTTVTLAEAVKRGILPCGLYAARKAQQRDPSFPRPVGRFKMAQTFDPEALRAWRPRPRGRQPRA